MDNDDKQGYLRDMSKMLRREGPLNEMFEDDGSYLCNDCIKKDNGEDE